MDTAAQLKPPDPAVATLGANSASRTPRSALKWALLLLPFGYLWYRLIYNLQGEWETDPQYSYGYVVPLLCLGLILQRWKGSEKAESAKQKVENSGQGTEVSRLLSTFCFLVFALLAFCYLPTRLIEVATPEWRPIQWSLGIITIGLTLCGIFLGWGRNWLKQLLFPICFVFVSIPWPTLIEQPVIQSLTRINAAMVIEVMGVLGIPAMQHGNVIEVGTGVVGIDEACSGIRSFQSSIMISLFLGALYDLPLVRRILFVPIGFLFAMLFNLARTSFLTWVAAKQGVAAIEKYHDPAGLWIMVGCTVGMWLVGLMMRSKAQKVESREHKAESRKQKAESGRRRTEGGGELAESEKQKVESREHKAESELRNPISAFSFQFSAFPRLALGLLLWLLFVEVGVQAWYRSREARLVASPNWSLVFPTDNPTLQDLPIATNTFALLRFDDGKQAAWTEDDGMRWSAFYFNWLPGRVAGYLAKRHTPEICMPATGRELQFGPELMVLDIQGLKLPVRRYVFGTPPNSLHVFHCRWEAGATSDSFVEQESARFNLIRGVWTGRGNQGQKIVEVIISGTDDPEQAKEALVRQLEKMIKVEDGRKEESRK